MSQMLLVRSLSLTTLFYIVEWNITLLISVFLLFLCFPTGVILALFKLIRGIIRGERQDWPAIGRTLLKYLLAAPGIFLMTIYLTFWEVHSTVVQVLRRRRRRRALESYPE